jgi:hypothetical protein
MRVPMFAAAWLLTWLWGPAVGRDVQVAGQNPFSGRWNITGTGPDADHVYWLDITNDGGTLTGLFLNRGGSPVPLAVVKIDRGELVFQTGRADRPGPEFRARLEGGTLMGSVAEGSRTVTWVGVRPPAWPAANANGSHTYGAPVRLFNGTSLDAWGVQIAGKPIGWSVVDGTMTNSPSANNLVSKARFKDFKIHAEYKLDQDSNSGIYLRGRYELQVLEDFGKPPDAHSHMSIYAWVAPLVNASRPIGEWQVAEAVIVGNKVSVVLNGRTVQDDATIQAITGGALDADETAPGPIMIQGDHSKVSYRTVTVTPITRPGR